MVRIISLSDLFVKSYRRPCLCLRYEVFILLVEVVGGRDKIVRDLAALQQGVSEKLKPIGLALQPVDYLVFEALIRYCLGKLLSK
ncbi:MAG: hypothetical protein ABL999_00995 [Pyrinomonadaceae bacterium]